MIRKLFLIMVVLLTTQPLLFSQVNDTINEREVGRIVRYLASDSLKGRGHISLDLLKATVFIRNEFIRAGLQVFPGAVDYCIPFQVYGDKNLVVMDQLQWNGKKVDRDRFIYLHPAPGNYAEKTLSDFKVIKVEGPINDDILELYKGEDSSLLLWTNQVQPGSAKALSPSLRVPDGGLKKNVLIVVASEAPLNISLNGFPSQYLTADYNVVGVIPGRKFPDEVIMFSAHYDHVGIGQATRDSIFNGANDNASGTTALLALAKYFSERRDNDRTLIFCAFTAEEIGLVGSRIFAEEIKPEKIIAGINIEMIGVPQYGRNRLFILGRRFSDLPGILESGLRKNGMRLVTEPAESKKLFQRSDNYPFALKGIPYHTIMASDDDENCYHMPCDDISRIDISNMTRVIKAIAASVRPLINGRIVPKRIRPSDVEIKEGK